MVRGALKISPWPLIRAHHHTYVDVRTKRPLVRDYVLLDAVPLGLGAVAAVLDLKLTTAASGALLAASGLLAALLFGVMLQISQRAIDWADKPPDPSKDTTEHAIFLREIAANAGYASLVCIAAAISYVFATISTHERREIASAIGIGLGAHLVLVLMMVMKRVFALTEERLTQVHTGAHRAAASPRRRAAGRGR